MNLLRMSRDVARMIYKLSKEDGLYSEDLRELYLKREEESKLEIRNKIYNLVREHIMTRIQPCENFLVLPTDLVGGVCETKRIYLRDVDKNSLIYFRNYKNDILGYLVNNYSSRYAIKYGILPLKLDWFVKDNKLIVTWESWVSADSATL